MADSFLLEDGTSHILLEDGSSKLLLEGTPSPPFDPSTGFPYQQSEAFPHRSAARSIALVYGAFVPPPQFGTAVRFNGNDNSGLENTTVPGIGPTNFTVAVFFWMPSLPSGSDESIWMLQDNSGGTPTNWINLEVNGTDLPGHLVCSSSPAVDIDLGAVSANTWYFAVISVNTSGNGDAYVGKINTTLTHTSLSSLATGWTPTDWTVATDNFTEPLNGRITGLKLWTTALSSGQASSEATSISPIYTPNVYAWYKLDHSATKLTDWSGNGNTLVARGSGTWVDEEGPFLLPGPFDPQLFPWKVQPTDFSVVPTQRRQLLSSIAEPIYVPAVAPFDPSTGFPWEPQTEVIRAIYRRPTTETYETIYIPGAAPFDPSTGFPWEQLPDPVRASHRTRASASFLFETLLDFGPTPKWYPDYPDFPGRSAKRPVNVGGSFHQLLDYGPLPTWLPDYPDFVWAARRPVNTGGSFQSLLDFGPLPTWLPDYPDFARTRQPSVEKGWFALVIQEHEPITDWLPEYPDFAARGPRKPVAVGEFEWIFVAPQTVAELWYPDYPDFVWAARRPVNTGGLFWTNLEYEPTDWFPEYPASIFRKTPPPHTWNAFIDVAQGFAPILSWAPEYPDFARARHSLVNEGWSAFVNVTASSGYAPLGSWYPDYPAFVYGQKTIASNLASVLVNVDYVPKLGWLSEYPDMVPRKQGIDLVSTGPTFVNVDYVPKLEWAPKFPDEMPTPLSMSAALRASVGVIHTQAPLVPLGSWYPSYPDRIFQDPRWDGWFAFVNIATATQTKLDWLPEIPDFTQRQKMAVQGEVFETLGNLNQVIFQARFAEHIQRALFLKSLELPLPNTLTRIYGIHQSDVVIASAIKVALADMRANPWTLDYVFASLPQDPITWKEYGEKSVQAAKEWFLKTDIAVMVTPLMDELKAPAISITLKESTEATNESTLGDVDSEPIEDNDTVWPPLCAPFTPASYVPSTGVVTLQTAPVDFYLAPGMFIVDKRGQAYEILDTTDSLTFSIAADSVPDLRDCTFKSSRPNYKVSVESSSFREVYTVGVHVGAEPVYCTWLHSIVLFALLRYKQVLLEARGFERSTVSSTDFERNPAFETENVYSRYINVSGYVRQYWPKNVSIKTDAVIPYEIKVSGQDADVKVGGDVDDLLWIGDQDMIDPNKRR